MKRIIIVCFAIATVFMAAQQVEASGFTVSGPSGFTAVTSEVTLINGISIGGDTGTVPVQVRVENGSLSMGTTAGLTFSSPTTGAELLFSGDVDDVNAALATLTYTRGSSGSEDIEVTIANADDDYYAATGNIYKYIDSNLTWNAARAAAEADAMVTGAGFDPAEVESYLATITSSGENSFATTRLGNNPAWIGASDAGSEGTWRWVTGPEASEDGSGRRFWNGLSSESDPAGSPHLGRYESWNNGEPNNSGDEDCAQFLGSNGLWNDLPCDSSTLGSVVEFRRIDGDPMVESESFTITTISNPSFNEPSGSSIVDELSFDIDVYAAGQSGSFQLIFEEDDEVVNTLTLADLEVGNHVFTIDHEDLTSNIYIDAATSNTLHEAIYDITLRYTYTDGSTVLEQLLESVAFDLEVPTVVRITPLDNGTTTNDLISIVFSEPVESGSVGAFIVRELESDDLHFASIFSGLDVAGSGTNTLTFTIDTPFRAGTEYYVNYPSGFFIDMRGREVAAISDTTTWNFTRAAGNQSMPQPVNVSLLNLMLESEINCAEDQVAHTATLKGEGIASAILSVDPQFIGESWKSFSGSLERDFVSNDGSITVYALVKNTDGGIAKLEISDTHTLNCPKEDVVEVTEDQMNEVESAEIMPVFDDYYDRMVAPDSGKTGPSPWDNSIEAISHVESGWYIRGENYDTVYYLDESMKRRPFWNAQVFRTHANWDQVIWVTDATLQTLKIGKPMLPKAGISLVKISSQPEVFYVDEGEILREVPSESFARAVFGDDWQSYIIDLDPTIFHLFTMGERLDAELVDRSRMIRAENLR